MQHAGTVGSTSWRVRLRGPRWTFARHYGEMIAAMMIGMLVFGVPLVAALEAVGVDASQWRETAPALMLFGMALSMTVPMVAWMRYRGHGWGPSAEMAASMFFASFAALAFLAAGLASDSGTLLAIQHSVMFPAMLGAMLIRPAEYAGHPGTGMRLRRGLGTGRMGR